MPHFTNLINEPEGPIIIVRVAVSTPRRAALLAAGQEVPTPKMARLLIDTGASMTSVDMPILTALGLQPTGSVGMHTPSTGTQPVTMPTYDIELYFSGHGDSTYTQDSMAVLGCDFSGQSIDGLFGRDALAQSRLIFSGPDQSWMLSF